MNSIGNAAGRSTMPSGLTGGTHGELLAWLLGLPPTHDSSVQDSLPYEVFPLPSWRDFIFMGRDV